MPTDTPQPHPDKPKPKPFTPRPGSGTGGVTQSDTVVPSVSAADSGAAALVADALAQYGLEDLGAWAWGLYKQGQTIDMIIAQLPQQQAFKDRYPAYDALAQAGRAITVQQYRAYEDQVLGDMHRYGVPTGMYDSRQGIANLMMKGVSAVEAGERLQLAAKGAFEAPEDVKQALRNQYGVDPNNLVGFYLDPDKALPLLEQQYRSAEVTGAAALSKIAIDTATSERLAAQGVGYGAATQGFANVQAMNDLTAAEQGGAVSQGELIGGQFGSGTDAAKVAKLAASRAAKYQASEGGAVANQTGVSGLRSANR